MACGFDHGKSRSVLTRTFSNMFLLVVANMFSLPLSIMLHSEVRDWHSSLRSRSNDYFSSAHHRPIHSQVCMMSFVGSVSTISDHLHRSLIASFLGNIIGALFVGLPAVYFYLGDWRAGGLRDVEEARIDLQRDRKNSDPSERTA